MSLASLETALLEYVADVLVNDCLLPVPERVQRYHGELPHVCCTENGMLAADWTSAYASVNFPNSAAGQSPCGGRFVTLISVKYVVCWPPLKFDAASGKAQLPEESTDALAATLADAAECVARALIHLTCDTFDLTDPFVEAIAATGSLVRFLDVTPIEPRGLCAGVRWRVYAAVRQPEIEVS